MVSLFQETELMVCILTFSVHCSVQKMVLSFYASTDASTARETEWKVTMFHILYVMMWLWQ